MKKSHNLADNSTQYALFPGEREYSRQEVLTLYLLTCSVLTGSSDTIAKVLTKSITLMNTTIPDTICLLAE
jgi:hypothetical protein